MTKKTKISWSKLSLYEQCPYKWKRAYIDKVRELPSEALLRGRKEHKRMENLILQRQLPEGEPVLSSFLEMYIYNPYIKNIKVEGSELKREYSSFILNGRVDVIVIYNNGKVVVVDWKTGHGEADEDQLKFYCLLALDFIPENFTHFEATFFYLDGGYFSGMKKYSLEDIKEFEEDIIKRCNKLLNEKEYKRKPNKYCYWCNFISECSNILKKYKFPESIDSIEKAIDIWQKKMLADAFSRKAEELLRNYLMKTGNKIINKKDFTKMELVIPEPELKFSYLTKEDIIDILLVTKKNNGLSKEKLKKMRLNQLKELMLSG